MTLLLQTNKQTNKIEEENKTQSKAEEQTKAEVKEGVETIIIHVCVVSSRYYFVDFVLTKPEGAF